MEKAANNGDEDAPALIEKFSKAIIAEKTVHTGDAQAQAVLAEVYMFMGNSLDQADAVPFLKQFHNPFVLSIRRNK